jgi:hypothetical protein
MLIFAKASIGGNEIKCQTKQFRGFAPFGMLACWNTGKMGFGITNS